MYDAAVRRKSCARKWNDTPPLHRMAAAFLARSATQVCRWFENTYRSTEFDRARRAFGGQRFEVLYRHWLTEGDAVLEAASSPHLGQALKDGRGRIESVVLP